MDRFERANHYHDLGFNCCQSVLAAFTDITGLSEQTSFDIAGGFGGGVGSGELCGAVSGAIMVLGMCTPIDPKEPVESKHRTLDRGLEFQSRFVERFGSLRCCDLKEAPNEPTEATPAAIRLGLTGGCGVLIVTAVELLEEMLAEQG